MHVLFDADILVFRCAFAAEYRIWFLKIGDKTHEFRYKREAAEALDDLLPGKYSRKEGEDYTMWSEVVLEPLSHAIQNITTLVSSVIEELGQSEFDIHMMLSPWGTPNFRHEVATSVPYKGNRDRSHRPTYEKELRNFIVETWPTTIAVNEEADDLLGIEQTRIGANSIIVSIDKDLDQIPGLKHNFTYNRTYEITNEQAIYNFHLQLLMGDSTDNIPGLPGIGVGKARKALHGLETEREQFAEVCRMYTNHSGRVDWEGYLREQGRLLWIRRQRGEMWEPDITEGEDGWDSQHLSLY